MFYQHVSCLLVFPTESKSVHPRVHPTAAPADRQLPRCAGHKLPSQPTPNWFCHNVSPFVLLTGKPEEADVIIRQK